jgi:uncharacterized protein (TIGR03382 family)
LRASIVAAVAVTAAAPRPADACGAFIARTEALRINDAIELAVVRDGNKTILTVRNRYQGPPEEFALLVPVPVVLTAEDVKTLSPTVFDELAHLTAPTLTYLEEQDPCEPPPEGDGRVGSAGGGPGGGVTVEAAFQVGEYDVEVLSAADASGLETWLHAHQYKIPPAMEPFLRPYVEEGSKFFVAKVDPARLTFQGDVATLSPLRFAYDSDEVSLPLRLSTANSPGVQDVIVYAIAGMRLEAANRPNAVIPTGVEMRHGSPGSFAEFYEALFAATLEKTPGAVVTEHVTHANRWRHKDILPALGAGVAGQTDELEKWVVTRLHLRVERDGVHDDLLLRQNNPIAGDRFSGHVAQPAQRNDFRAEYVVRRYWTGEARCDEPRWGRWETDRNAGGGEAIAIGVRADPTPLAELTAVDVPSLDVKTTYEPPARRAPGGAGGDRKKRGGCGCSGGGAASPLAALALLALRRRRRAS